MTVCIWQAQRFDVRHAIEENDWSEVLTSKDLNAWTRVKIQEFFHEVRQEDDHRNFIVQQILQKGTDFLRRIIAPVGGVTLSDGCPYCHRFLIEGIYLVGFNKAREEAVQLLVRRARQPVQRRKPEQSLGYKDSTDCSEAKVSRAHAPPQGACENFVCAPKLLANQQLGETAL